jgi:5,5'-dehydrodivanillate O-demethylase
LPAPLLPNWDFLTWDDVYYDIGSCLIPCNYLQIMENSLDPVHVEWLHVHFSNYVLERLGRQDLRRQGWNNNQGDVAQHKLIKFDTFDYGILKKRIMDNTDENHPYWTMGHPIVFPNILKTTGFQYRVPIDDENTYHWWLFPYKLPAETGMTLPQDKVPYYEVPSPSVLPNGRPTWDLLDNNSGQDIMMWITQGGIADRTQERLGLSDKGLIQYRQMLLDNLKKIERGEEPMNVFRTPEENKYHELPSEYWYLAMQASGTTGLNRTGGSSKYSPVMKEAVRRLRGEEALKQPVF